MEPVAFTSTVLPSTVDYFDAQDITVRDGIAKVVCTEGKSMEPVAFTSTVLPSSVDYFEAQDITVSDGFDCH